MQTIFNCGDTKERADVLLSKTFPKYSRSALAKLFDLEKITKNNRPIKAGDKIKPQESIKADTSPLQKAAEKIDLPVIYEDEEVIVINKPEGVISHARGKYWDEASVASFIRSKVATQKKPIKEKVSHLADRAGIVHRLDRATSGVMICAKTTKALKFLHKQFNDKKVKKVYIAIVEGVPVPKEAIIDVPIERNPNSPQTFRPGTNGKRSATKYNVLKNINNRSIVILSPHTGRTHQIRVHLKYIGHPVIGDNLYGKTKAERLMLHAYNLKIKLPSGKDVSFYSPLPPAFLKELEYDENIIK